MKIAAYIMAGGGSRRFGKDDKARAVVGGERLVERNAATLRERYGEVTVVSAPGRSYEDLGLRTIEDVFAGKGPLAGIHAALVDTDADAIAVAACDLHGLRTEWYQLLEDACEGRHAAAFHDGARWQPLVAIYRRTLLDELERRLREGPLAARALLDDFGTRVEPPQEFADLRSIDRRVDLEESP